VGRRETADRRAGTALRLTWREGLDQRTEAKPDGNGNRDPHSKPHAATVARDARSLKSAVEQAALSCRLTRFSVGEPADAVVVRRSYITVRQRSADADVVMGARPRGGLVRGRVHRLWVRPGTGRLPTARPGARVPQHGRGPWFAHRRPCRIRGGGPGHPPAPTYKPRGSRCLSHASAIGFGCKGAIA
jgi:hypothetical protein